MIEAGLKKARDEGITFDPNPSSVDPEAIRKLADKLTAASRGIEGFDHAIGELAGVSPQTVTNLREGITLNPRPSTLEKVERGLTSWEKGRNKTLESVPGQPSLRDRLTAVLEAENDPEAIKAAEAEFAEEADIDLEDLHNYRLGNEVEGMVYNAIAEKLAEWEGDYIPTSIEVVKLSEASRPPAGLTASTQTETPDEVDGLPEPFSVEEAQDSSQSRSQPDHLEIDDADDSALTEGKLQLPDDDQVVEDEDDASMEGVSKPDDESQAPDSAESTTEIKLPLDQKVSSTPADYSQEDLVVHLLEKLSTLSISQDSSDFVVVARLIATQLLILRHSQKSALAVELTINGDEWTHLIEATNDF